MFPPLNIHTPLTHVFGQPIGRHKSKQESKCVMLSEENTHFNPLKEANLQHFFTI